MNVVITGATGHLGRWACHAFAAAGHRVVAASRRGTTPEPPFGAAPPPAGAVSARAVDLADEKSVGPLGDAIAGADAVVHLAAWHPPATATTSAADRGRLLEVNVFGTMRLLEAVKRSGAHPVVVYASTFEVYGAPETDPVDEAHPTRPLTDYGATKLSGEDHLMSFAQEDTMRVVALRLPAIYGPGEITPRALPLFLQAAARGERPVVYGDGLDVRSLIYAADAAAALVAAATGGASGIFNVADGERHQVIDLARAAMRAAGLEGEPELRPRQKPRLDYHLSVERAARELGFRPRVGLAEGLAEQLRWLRSEGTAGQAAP